MATTPAPDETPTRAITIRVTEARWEQIHKLAFDQRTSKQALVIAALDKTYGKP